MVDDVYSMVVAAKDAASATLARVGAEVNTLTGTTTKAKGPMALLGAATGGLVNPATLALGATAALSVGLAQALENAKEDQQSQRLLGAALEANIPAWDGNTDAIEKVIESRLKLGFTDEEQRQSLRQLVAQTKDQTKALDLQATAMDLARLRNIDLTTASTLLGKVQGGNIGILARYGIQLEKGTTATEAIAEIQRRAAGQAEAWSEGLEGQTAALGIAMDEVGERIGYALIGPMTDAVNFLNDDVVPAFDDVLTGIGDVSQGLDDFQASVGKTGDAAREMGIELDPSEWAMSLHNAIDGAIRSLNIDLPEAFGQPGKAANDMSEDWARSWSSMAGTVTTQGGFIVSAAKDIANDAAAEMGKVPEKAGQAIIENQFHFNDAVDRLRQYMEDYLTPKQEKMRIQAFLSSKAVADGLASGRPAVVRETERMIAEAERRWKLLTGRTYGYGLEVARTFGSGLLAGNNYVRDAAGVLRESVQGALEFSGSPAYTHSREIGEEVARTYGEGLNSGMAKIGVPALPGQGGSSVGGGGPITVVLNLDGREVARAVVPHVEREARRQGKR